ncbi:MAG: hypothetical protein U0572_09830 [Phycisphaerales bacterium]
MTTPTRGDAAPSGNGAGVKHPNCQSHSTVATLRIVPLVRNDAPDTSRRAARRVVGHAAAQRVRVLALLGQLESRVATDEEFQDALCIPSNTKRPRRWELVNAGVAIASGRTRKTRSGCAATVWVAREHAPKPEGSAA